MCSGRAARVHARLHLPLAFCLVHCAYSCAGAPPAEPLDDKAPGEPTEYVVLALPQESLENAILVASLNELAPSSTLVASEGVGGSSQALLPALAVVPLYYYLGGSVLVVATALALQQGLEATDGWLRSSGGVWMHADTALALEDPGSLRPHEASPEALIDWAQAEAAGLVASSELRFRESPDPVARIGAMSRYLVVLKRSAGPLDTLLARLASEYGAYPHDDASRLQHALYGFVTGPLHREDARALSADAAVEWVEEDGWLEGFAGPATQRVSLEWDATRSLEETNDCRPEGNHAHASEIGKWLAADPYRTNGPPWSLDRIDQRNLPLDCQYTPAGTGHGATIYVVDDGVVAQPELGARYLREVTMHDAAFATGDCRYGSHGTPVATAAVGLHSGVAKGASLVSVRTLCAGRTPNSTIAAGLDWIAGELVARPHPAVVNLSIKFDMWYLSVVRAAHMLHFQHNAVVVKSAGNQGCLAGLADGASFDFGISVGSTTAEDQLNPASNFGGCVHLYAPGLHVPTFDATSQLRLSDGTSFAAPLVAGAAAIYLERHPYASSSQVKRALLGAATPNVLSGPLGAPFPRTSQNRLLYVGSELLTH